MQAKAAAGGALAVIVGVAAFLFWPGEASRVRARVTAAAEALSARPGEGDVNRLARLAGFARGLARDVVVEAEPGGPAIRGREAVAALASQLSAVGAPHIELTDLEVTLDATSSNAVVTAVVHLTAVGPGGSAGPGGAAGPGLASGFDGDVVRIDLVRGDDGWLIVRAAPEPALAR